MKFVALVSGGKDSVYSILECRRLGHELVACVHLGAAEDTEEESYMYQTAASETITTLVEECLGVPLIFYQRVGKSLNTSLVYQEAMAGDEVEDLYLALRMARDKFPDIQAVSSGAILSTYQRVRIENVCSRLALTSLSYLWRLAPQHDLLDRMIQDDITAVLVRAACPPGLEPFKHLNKTLKELQPLFLRLNQRYQFHVCGEGGEYESLVLDCPLYKKRLVLDEVEVVELEGDEGVGVLKIIKCHAEEKTDVASGTIMKEALERQSTTSISVPPVSPTKSTSSGGLGSPACLNIRYLPQIKSVGGGLWHVSELMVPVPPIPTSNNKNEEPPTEAELAVQEAQVVLTALGKLLEQHGCTAQDVMFVHLYLSEISHFAKINEFYREFFGTFLPPSRSCVAVGRHVLPGGRRVSLDCMIQCGSGDYLRAKRGGPSPYADAALDNISFRLREVLHVQSISHWAPVCVGPYSQTNTLRSGLHFLAGQIGLKPATMALHSDWKEQLHQSWTNVASVLDALEGGGSLKQILSGVVYVADHVYHGHSGPFNENVENDTGPAIDQVQAICKHLLEQNGGVIPGKVDSPTATPPVADDDESKEDGSTEGDSTEEGATSTCPLLVVSIPEMPVGAVVEVEVITATLLAASCLPMVDSSFSYGAPNIAAISTWDTGHDFRTASSASPSPCTQSNEVQIQVHLRRLGYGCAAVATVTAHLSSSPEAGAVVLDTGSAVQDMTKGLSQALAGEGGSPTGLSFTNVLHTRLFYVSSKIDGSTGERSVLDDGLFLRSSLQAALATECKSSTTEGVSPALSVIPVQAIEQLIMDGSSFSNATEATTIVMSLQAVVIDPTQLETELWIHHGRQ